jgi:hypothetical protein
VSAVELPHLCGDAIPQWIIDRSRHRAAGVTGKVSTHLVYEWAIAGAGRALGKSDRLLLRELLDLPYGHRISYAQLAARCGVSAGHLRWRIADRLEAAGWLRRSGPGQRVGHAWFLTVPPEPPEDHPRTPADPVDNPTESARYARIYDIQMRAFSGANARVLQGNARVLQGNARATRDTGLRVTGLEIQSEQTRRDLTRGPGAANDDLAAFTERHRALEDQRAARQQGIAR